MSFLDNFFNYDLLGGSPVSEQAYDSAWNVAVGTSATATVSCISTWETDFRRDLPTIDIPVLVVQGGADRILPLANTGKRLPALIKDCELSIIVGGLHAIAWTHADQVNQFLVSFIK